MSVSGDVVDRHSFFYPSCFTLDTHHQYEDIYLPIYLSTYLPVYLSSLTHINAMDKFLENMLGDRGCTVDGSTTTNPVVQLADRMFDSQLGSALGGVGIQQPVIGGAGAAAHFATEESTRLADQAYHQAMQNAMMQQQSQGQGGVGMAMDMNMNMMNENSMMMAMMQQQQIMSQQMIMMSQGMGIYDQEYNRQEHEEELHHQKQAVAREKELERRADFLVAMDQRKLSVTETQNAIREYNDMWIGRQKANYTASKAGYEEAWNRTAEKLAHESYVLRENNPYKDDENSFEKGMQLYGEGKINEAIYAFEAATLIEDEHSEAWNMLGKCHNENDDDKKAILCLSKAVEYDPYNLEALLALGTSHVNELNPNKALEALRDWISHNPKFQGLTVTPDAYSDGSLMSDVQQLVLSAKEWAPNDPDVLILLGVLHNVSRDYEYAISTLKEALSLRPDDYSIMNKIGATMANNDKSSEALDFYRQALQIRPSYTRSLINLGISETNLNNYSEAIKHYVQALKYTPTAEQAWGYLRVVFSSMRRYDLVELTNKQDISALESRLLEVAAEINPIVPGPAPSPLGAVKDPEINRDVDIEAVIDNMNN